MRTFPFYSKEILHNLPPLFKYDNQENDDDYRLQGMKKLTDQQGLVYNLTTSHQNRLYCYKLFKDTDVNGCKI